METLFKLINDILVGAGGEPMKAIDFGKFCRLKLREDIGLDSYQLAELTVKLEDLTGIDVFAGSAPVTLADVLAVIGGGK